MPYGEYRYLGSYSTTNIDRLADPAKHFLKELRDHYVLADGGLIKSSEDFTSETLNEAGRTFFRAQWTRQAPVTFTNADAAIVLSRLVIIYSDIWRDSDGCPLDITIQYRGRDLMRIKLRWDSGEAFGTTNLPFELDGLIFRYQAIPTRSAIATFNGLLSSLPASQAVVPGGSTHHDVSGDVVIEMQLKNRERNWPEFSWTALRGALNHLRDSMASSGAFYPSYIDFLLVVPPSERLIEVGYVQLYSTHGILGAMAKTITPQALQGSNDNGTDLIEVA